MTISKTLKTKITTPPNLIPIPDRLLIIFGSIKPHLRLHKYTPDNMMIIMMMITMNGSMTTIIPSTPIITHHITPDTTPKTLITTPLPNLFITTFLMMKKAKTIATIIISVIPLTTPNKLTQLNDYIGSRVRFIKLLG
jgi:hypothetical protein